MKKKIVGSGSRTLPPVKTLTKSLVLGDTPDSREACRAALEDVNLRILAKSRDPFKFSQVSRLVKFKMNTYGLRVNLSKLVP